MSRYFKFKFAAFLWCLLLGIATAEAAQTPEEFGEKYIAAIRAEGIVASLQYWHPEELQKIADLLNELIDIGASKGVPPPFMDKGETAESLKKLTAKQLVEKFMKWIEKQIPQLSGLLKNAQVRIIGHVTDGDVIYLVTKATNEKDGEKVEHVDFYPLKKLGDEYRAIPKPEFFGMVRGVIKQIKNAR